MIQTAQTTSVSTLDPTPETTNAILDLQPLSRPKLSENELAWQRLQAIDLKRKPALYYSTDVPDWPTFIDVMAALGITVQDNLITGKTEVIGMPKKHSAENALNILPGIVLDFCRSFFTKPGRDQIIDYLGRMSDLNRYNPVIEYLKAADQAIQFNPNEYPGPNVQKLCNDVLHLPTDDALSRVLVSKWLVQSIAMAHNGRHGEPYGADGVLTLKGAQGKGKTRFFETIVPKHEWGRQGATIDMNRDDSQVNAISAWIVELGEVDATLKREQSNLKNFITQPRDNLRKPYAKAHVDNPRRTSFGATVNDDNFLRDATGSRRWWTVPVEDIDWQLLENKKFLEAIWAEAMAKYISAPQSFRLTAFEQAMLAKRNIGFDVPLIAEEEIRDGFDWTKPEAQWATISVSDLKKRIGLTATSQQIGQALSKIMKDDPRIKKGRGTGGFTTYFLPSQY